MSTLRRAVRLRGRGLMSGRAVEVRIAPGRSGWRWAADGPLRPLRPRHASPLPHRARLVDGDQQVELPEHVLAACVLLDLDAVDLHFPQGEAPILDGSARPILEALAAAGLGGGRRHEAELSVGWRGSELRWDGSRAPAAARTFLDRGDARRLRSAFPGARPGCAVLLDGDSAMYAGRPRMPREPLHHKLLDLLGDLGPWRALGPLAGVLHVDAPSHQANRAAIAAAFESGQLRTAEA